jgi:4-amino-4-deoxy-L-arabinose transferase-like glycosyltransferase
MRGRRLEWICTGLLVALASWYWLLYFNRSTNLLDEGSTAAQAMRIVNGQLIYRDFFTVVTPGSYYTIAWLFRLFGESLMLLRWAALATGIGILLSTLTVGRRVMVWPFAAAAGLLTTVWGWFLVTPNFYSLEAALLSLLALACYVYGAPSRRWMLAAGLAAGITAMVKQNVGAYTAAGLFLTIWLSRLFDDQPDWRGRMKMSGQFVAGVSFPVLATVLWLAASGAGSYLYESWVYYPLVKYTERFARPFPDFFPIAGSDPFDLWTKLVIYLPAIVYPFALVAIGALAVRFHRGDRDAKSEGHCATRDHVGWRADAPAGVAARRRAAHPVRTAADVHPLRVLAVVRVARSEVDPGPAGRDCGDRHAHRARAGGNAVVERLQADRLGISELHRRGAHRSRERDLRGRP